jgi:TrmH family RNA methyltransferase
MLSRNKERILGRLKSARGRQREGLFVVEGVRAAEEALDAGASIHFAVCSGRLEQTERGRELADRIQSAVRETIWVEDDVLEVAAHTESPQGVLLVCREPQHALSDLPPGRILVLDGVQDPGNLGTLVRAAAAFAMDAVVVLHGTVDPWNSKAVRASAGACLRLPLVRSDSRAFLDWAQGGGVPVLVAAADGADVEGIAPGASWALVIGSEASGASTQLRDASRETVSVPMPGGVESLNAAVAGAILLYALNRRN